MLWKRLIVVWMTLLVLVLASTSASARTDVDVKPHVGAIDVVAAICIEVQGVASAGAHQEDWVPVATETSDVPDATRGATSGYSVAFETTIARASAGTRGAHFKAANEALRAEMRSSPEIARAIEGPR